MNVGAIGIAVLLCSTACSQIPDKRSENAAAPVGRNLSDAKPMGTSTTQEVDAQAMPSNVHAQDEPSLSSRAVDSAPDMAGSPPSYLVLIQPGPNRHFIFGAEKEGCPAATLACRRKAYVIPGDLLVASDVQGDFTHVAFLANAADQPTIGWLASNDLRRISSSASPLAGWIGKWSNRDASVDIQRGKRPGTLHAVGSAIWGADAASIARGDINLGDFEGDVIPKGDWIRYRGDPSDDDPCRVDMKLLGPYLSVVDNSRCGGLNVSFTGIYRR